MQDPEKDLVMQHVQLLVTVIDARHSAFIVYMGICKNEKLAKDILFLP